MSRLRLDVGLLAALAAAACACGDGSSGAADAGPSCSAPPAAWAPSVDDALDELDGLAFDAFLDASFEHLLRRFPDTASSLGLSDELGIGDDRLTPISDAYESETARYLAGVRERLDAFDANALSSEQRLALDIYTFYLDDAVDAAAYRYYDYPVTQNLTAQQVQLMRFMTDLHPVADAATAEGYIARLQQMSLWIEQLEARLDAREAMGLVPPRILLEQARPQIHAWATAEPRSSELYTTFADRLADVDTLDEAARAELLSRAEVAIACHALPALLRLRDRVDAMIAIAPTTLGVGALPGGAAFYDHALAHHTTTAMTADAIHELGLAELERIHAEIRAQLADLGYGPGLTIPQAFAAVVTDGGLVPESEVVATYEAIIAAAFARLPDAFASVPDGEVVVIGGPTGGFYIPGSTDGSRPAAFYARVGGPEPRYGMATLAYHETVPGHHLQIATAQELDLALFRRHTRFTAYVEGWALYSERLAAELGWYDDDPYGDLGRLQGEAFRAARLVVDTGIHARGWTYDQAVDFMVDNVGYGRPGMEGQVSRYAAAPGQATAYKVGMNEILALRARAMDQLGDGFDLRAFHAAVLGNGSVPLVVLEQLVDAYIAAN